MLSVAVSTGNFLSSIGFFTGFISSLKENLDACDIIYKAIQLAAVGILATATRQAVPNIAAYMFDSMSGSIVFHTKSPDTALAIFSTAYVSIDDPSGWWIMAYLAQDEEVQKQLKSSCLNASDGRRSKYVRGDRFISKLRASFIMDNIVGQMMPINGEPDHSDDQSGA